MKPQSLAIMLLGKRKNAASDEHDDASMPDGKEVAQELIDAVKAGDADGVWKAFQGLSACAEDGEGDEPDESDDSEEHDSKY